MSEQLIQTVETKRRHIDPVSISEQLVAKAASVRQIKELEAKEERIRKRLELYNQEQGPNLVAKRYAKYMLAKFDESTTEPFLSYFVICADLHDKDEEHNAYTMHWLTHKYFLEGFNVQDTDVINLPASDTDVYEVRNRDGELATRQGFTLIASLQRYAKDDQTRAGKPFAIQYTSQRIESDTTH
ncbi:hypothetical protein BH23PAT2_BH23PAT2_01710 [soil metagenome]